MFIIQDTLKCLYALVTFISVLKSLTDGQGLLKIYILKYV